MNNVTETLFESLNSATMLNNPFKTERTSEAIYTARNKLNAILLNDDITDNVKDIRYKIDEYIDDLMYVISLNSFNVGMKTAFQLMLNSNE